MRDVRREQGNGATSRDHLQAARHADAGAIVSRQALTSVAGLARVMLGYVVALAIATAAVAIRIEATSGPDAQASSGMYAFGDAMLFVGVFGVLAMVPTAWALRMLGSHRWFWAGLAGLCAALALTGMASALLFTLGRDQADSPLALAAQLSVLRLLIAPLFCLIFALCAVFCRFGRMRRVFLAATAAELAVSAYAGLLWFIPLFVEHWMPMR